MCVQSAALLTETLLSQVHIDDEEHESSRTLFLPTNKCVHPALQIIIRVIVSKLLVETECLLQFRK